MEYFKDEKEAIDLFIKLFEEGFKDPDLAESLKKVKQLIWYDYTQSGPNCSFWLDCRGDELKVGPGKPADEPDLVISLSADNGHRLWLNKLNSVVAITTRKIKVKGSLKGLMKLSPKMKQVGELYVKVLKDEGKDHLII
jgi:putative sterol carrier protein